MIRLLLVLLVLAGVVYLVLLDGGDEEQRVDVQYKEKQEELRELEQRMLQDAEKLQDRADQLSR